MCACSARVYVSARVIVRAYVRATVHAGFCECAHTHAYILGHVHARNECVGKGKGVSFCKCMVSSAKFL